MRLPTGRQQDLPLNIRKYSYFFILPNKKC